MKVEIYTTAEDGKVIKLLESIPIKVKGIKYIVPAGYLSNGLSCPRCLWSLLSPAIDNRTLKSACGHDWLYENHVCTRKEADDWFYDDLISNGFPKIKAYLVWLGVRIGGKSHYNN